jgi:hypothetical protein
MVVKFGYQGFCHAHKSHLLFCTGEMQTRIVLHVDADAGTYIYTYAHWYQGLLRYTHFLSDRIIISLDVDLMGRTKVKRKLCR